MAPFEPLSFRADTAPPSPEIQSSWLRYLPWVVGAIAIHAALLAALTLVPPPVVIEPPQPFAVELIDAPQQTKPEPPKPQPKVERRPAPTPPVPVSRIPIPTALTTNEKPTPPAPPAPEAPATPKSSGEPAPAPVVQPRFDAAYLNNPAPAYPPVSRRMGETGRVMLRVHVLPAGTPDEVEIRTTSGFPRLDNAAVEAVKRWRFIPAKQGSELVAAWVVVPISFSLEN